MQADHTITPKLVNNRGWFNSEFFDRFTLRTAPQPLQLTDSIAKDFFFLTQEPFSPTSPSRKPLA